MSLFERRGDWVREVHMWWEYCGLGNFVLILPITEGETKKKEHKEAVVTKMEPALLRFLDRLFLDKRGASRAVKGAQEGDESYDDLPQYYGKSFATTSVVLHRAWLTWKH